MTPIDSGRAPPSRLPLFLIAGFLGAGKTTLLNRILKDPGLADALVLIDEFGDTPIDHHLVERSEGDMIFLSSGCACCALRGDFIDALERILRDLDNGRIRPVGKLIVEASGLADPAPLIHTLTAHPYLSLRFRLDAIVTVVDALSGLERIDDCDEALRQVVVADRLAIAKTDLLGDGNDARAHLDALTSLLHALNPCAEIFDAARDRPEAAQLFTARPFDVETKSPDLARWLRAEQFAAPLRAAARRVGTGGHETRSAIAQRRGVASLTIRVDAALAPAALAEFVEQARARYGTNLLRLKGLVRLADDLDRPLVVNGVQHVLYPTIRLAAWPGDDRRTRIVFILKNLDPGAIERLWAAYVGLTGPHDVGRLIDPGAIERSGLFS